ncbi:MAG TPA: polyamine ABC transporter ATP-binding protein [Steroidobacteraceae bacterium]|jgi:putrescine transport system ATP-binding protein|nr:polyamine ABC transporter ATP-binding protein [Steroidobacteraceae bacterium]
MLTAERRVEKNKTKNEAWRDPHAEAYVRIENVTKRFGDFVAVNNVSLKIFKGEIFCLLGGSGCGKSTLLRMMAGFENPSAGSLFLDGQDMAGVPPYERPINMMFQSYALFPHMTVEKNIAFGLEQEKGLSRADIATRVTDILEIVKLGSFAARRPHQLSGGQRQRVALARSLVKRPKLLLLDEPLGALDKKLREATQFELINIQEQLGVTFIVVTHDQEESMTLASRIGVMNRGEIVQIGTPTEIYEFPQNKFVADFIGSVNMFEGTMIEDLPDHVRIKSDELGSTIYVDHGISAAPGAIVYTAIRPEKINILRAPPADTSENCVKGVVKEIAYMGDMSIYLVKIDTGKIIRVTLPNVERMSDDERIGWDEPVWLTWHGSSPVVVTQ